MIVELSHPLIKHKVNTARIQDISADELRRTLKELGFMLVYEALKDIPLKGKVVRTWIGNREFKYIDEEDIVFVPILRAGLSLLEGALQAVPNAKVGFLGIKRDEETLISHIYYSRLPDLKEKTVLILDPMLATGGTLEVALKEIMKHSPLKVKSVHVIASPEGLKRIENEFGEVEIFVGNVDERLNDRGYIIPGLGDIGDRLYSVSMY
ncbi:MAG: uracil phosphoribosyltransferase [Aquifex sp.]|nr:MAG: uracil phosphoribosyltransferase [Aquifex sp.]